MLSNNGGLETPPLVPVIDCARLLHHAIVDGTVQFAGRTLLFVDGNELGQVPCLAICENKKLSEVLLFHCDSEWNGLGCSAHPSVAESKARAERTYVGISARWVDAGISERTADAFLDEQFGNERCSFCGKRPRRDQSNDPQTGPTEPRGPHLRSMYQRVLQRAAQIADCSQLRR
jgi:hypothetical protein